MRTWRLPDFSALLIDFRASLRTEVLTILAVVVVGDSQWLRAIEVSTQNVFVSLQKPEPERVPSVCHWRGLQLLS